MVNQNTHSNKHRSISNNHSKKSSFISTTLEASTMHRASTISNIIMNSPIIIYTLKTLSTPNSNMASKTHLPLNLLPCFVDALFTTEIPTIFSVKAYTTYIYKHTNTIINNMNTENIYSNLTYSCYEKNSRTVRKTR